MENKEENQSTGRGSWSWCEAGQQTRLPACDQTEIGWDSASCRPQHPEDASRVSGDKVDKAQFWGAMKSKQHRTVKHEIAIFPKA